MPPTNSPDPMNVAKNGAFTFYSHAAIPAEAPVVSQFCFPSMISRGISSKPM